MKIKPDTPVEISQTSTVNITDNKYRFVGYEELTYKKVIKLEEQLKIINEKLDELLGTRMIYCRDCKYFDTYDFDSGFCALMDKYISIFKKRYEVFCNDYCSRAVKRENTVEILGETDNE